MRRSECATLLYVGHSSIACVRNEARRTRLLSCDVEGAADEDDTLSEAAGRTAERVLERTGGVDKSISALSVCGRPSTSEYVDRLSRRALRRLDVSSRNLTDSPRCNLSRVLFRVSTPTGSSPNSSASSLDSAGCRGNPLVEIGTLRFVVGCGFLALVGAVLAAGASPCTMGDGSAFEFERGLPADSKMASFAPFESPAAIRDSCDGSDVISTCTYREADGGMRARRSSDTPDTNVEPASVWSARGGHRRLGRGCATRAVRPEHGGRSVEMTEARMYISDVRMMDERCMKSDIRCAKHKSRLNRRTGNEQR